MRANVRKVLSVLRKWPVVPLGRSGRDCVKMRLQRLVVTAHGDLLQASSVCASQDRMFPGSQVDSAQAPPVQLPLGLPLPVSTCKLGSTHGSTLTVERIPVVFSLFLF